MLFGIIFVVRNYKGRTDADVLYVVIINKSLNIVNITCFCSVGKMKNKTNIKAMIRIFVDNIFIKSKLYITCRKSTVENAKYRCFNARGIIYMGNLLEFLALCISERQII